MAIQKVKEYAEQGYTTAVLIDLSKYFDTLNAKHNEKLGRMAAPPPSDVYLEAVEAPEDEGEEPAETWNPGMGGIPVWKFP